MGWPVTINGRTWTAAHFQPYAYAQNFPDIVQDISDVGAAVQQAAAIAGGYAQPEVIVNSAATANIGAANSPFIQITGSGTITSFGTVANRIRFLRFTFGASLTHNATTLNLPGDANIVTRPGDTAIAISDASGNWRVVNYQRSDGSSTDGQTKIDIITSTSTWTRPNWASEVTIFVIGGGGGGGSGRRGASGTVRTGGGGGGAGGLAFEVYAASELAATLSIEIGGGGAGGAAASADNANGSPGDAGSQTLVRLAGNIILRAYGGFGGGGGSTGTAVGGAAGNGFSYDFPNGDGGPSSNTGGTGSSGSNGVSASSGGGGGGGISAANSPAGGGGAGFAYLIGGSSRTVGGGAAGAAGNAGGAGSPKSWDRGFGSGGGGGGAGDAAGTTIGRPGGAGGLPSGGGGGGGAATNGVASGAGGAGGRGEVWIITRG